MELTRTQQAFVRQMMVHSGREVAAVEEPSSRDAISELAMSMSLCPVHFIDWAICFDDEPMDCRQIRALFPYGHDT